VRGFDAVKNGVLLKVLDLIYSLRVRRTLPDADILVTNTFWLPLLAADRAKGAVYVHVARMPKGQMRLYGRAARLQGISRAVSAAISAEVGEARVKVATIPLPLPWTPVPHVPPLGQTILYVGRVHPEKGLHLLIDAAARLREEIGGWRLRIVGPSAERLGGGGSRHLAELQQRAESAGVVVEWGEPVFGERELRAEYENAGIFVYPSLAERGETFGLAPLEAMSCGRPVVVSDLACFREYVRPGENGRVFDHRAPDPAAELATALRTLLGAEETRARYAEAALATAQEFVLARVASRYLEDFEKIVSG
jgi:glycosyltransferase involved in cell wall biosynthesis